MAYAGYLGIWQLANKFEAVYLILKKVNHE